MTDPADPKPQGERLPTNVYVLGGASLLNDVASEMTYPLLQVFLIGVVGAGTGTLGVIEGIAESVSSLLKLVSGVWSDRLGRRKGLVVFGYGLPALVRPLTGLVTTPWQLLLIRLTDRLGKGVRTSPRDALLADSTPAAMQGRAFGFHRAMDHLGAALGPLLAMLFLWWRPGELRTLFFLTAVPGLCVVLLLLWALREPERAATAPKAPGFSLAPFGRGFRLYLLALVIFTLGNSSDLFLLYRAGKLGVPEWQLPGLWCVFHVAKSSGNLAAGRAVDRYGPRPLILSGWLVYSGVYLAFALSTQAWQMWVFFLLYAAYYALTEAAEKKLVVELAGAQGKGMAFGWYNLAIGIAALPASAAFGLVYQYLGPLAAFGSGSALALAASVLLASSSYTQHRTRMNADLADPRGSDL
jgi:MFS family permease